jgi:hypothetical protein
MDLLDRMYDLMKQWALANDIVSADNGIFKHASAYTNKVMQTQGRLLDLLECMGSSERPIFILVDEIQRFFSARYDTFAGQPPHEFFKELVSPSRRNGNVFFVVTGSSMCTAWQNFALASVNGHSLLGTRKTLNIPVNQSKTVAEVTQQQLNKWWNAAYCDTKDPLPQTLSIHCSHIQRTPAT